MSASQHGNKAIQERNRRTQDFWNTRPMKKKKWRRKVGTADSSKKGLEFFDAMSASRRSSQVTPDGVHEAG